MTARGARIGGGAGAWLCTYGLIVRPRLLAGVPHRRSCGNPCLSAAHEGARVSGARFESWSYETDRPISLDALRKTAAKLPAGIYRAKGVVATSEAPERRGVLQVVGKRVDVSFGGGWGGQAPRTRIVAIGAAGTIHHGDLEKHWPPAWRNAPGA